jgi:hypothetical protein
MAASRVIRDGVVLGKALESLQTPRGTICMLVVLQVDLLGREEGRRVLVSGPAFLPEWGTPPVPRGASHNNQPRPGARREGIMMMKLQNTRLFSGGHKGAEAEFGRNAEHWDIPETTFSFEGHVMEHSGEVRMLDAEELARGDVSMDFVFANLGRRFRTGEHIRRVIQSIFHMVNGGKELFAVGRILPDDHVMGGTGWGVELAKFFNRKVSVFDQDKERWYTWAEGRWQESEPTISGGPFAATGTRNLTDAGREAIRVLFERSFGPDAT